MKKFFEILNKANFLKIVINFLIVMLVGYFLIGAVVQNSPLQVYAYDTLANEFSSIEFLNTTEFQNTIRIVDIYDMYDSSIAESFSINVTGLTETQKNNLTSGNNFGLMNYEIVENNETVATMNYTYAVIMANYGEPMTLTYYLKSIEIDKSNLSDIIYNNVLNQYSIIDYDINYNDINYSYFISNNSIYDGVSFLALNETTFGEFDTYNTILSNEIDKIKNIDTLAMLESKETLLQIEFFNDSGINDKSYYKPNNTFINERTILTNDFLIVDRYSELQEEEILINVLDNYNLLLVEEEETQPIIIAVNEIADNITIFEEDNIISNVNAGIIVLAIAISIALIAITLSGILIFNPDLIIGILEIIPNTFLKAFNTVTEPIADAIGNNLTNMLILVIIGFIVFKLIEKTPSKKKVGRPSKK